MKKIVLLTATILLTFSHIFAQASQPERTDLAITLNEQFFDAFLETIFKNFKPVEFNAAEVSQGKVKFENAVYKSEQQKCGVIKLEREISGMRSAVRFREGRVLAPIAFSGSYDIPLFGCADFTGWAETNVALEFDREKQTLFARVKVVNVTLNGVTGLASGVLSKLMQSSIDKKVNPVTIMNTEKLSFIFPLESMGGNLRMKATDVKTEVVPGELKVRIFYELSKE